MQKNCPICSKEMIQKISNYNYQCLPCDYWSADLPYEINTTSKEIFGESEENDQYISFLDAIRIQNFNILLNRIDEFYHGKKLKILDVGCATGLFLKVAQSRGHQVVGLEPNPKMAKSSQKKGLNVINGYFPNDISDQNKFDIIIFNDVFEHIPDLSIILSGVNDRLDKNGMLIINLPNSNGFFFKLGAILYKVGFTNLWDRLWQKMFYTPHLHYFNEKSLNKYVSKYSFKTFSPTLSLDILSIDGLWDRISADKDVTFFKKIFLYVATITVYPFLNLFPKDAFASFYKRVSDVE